MSVRRSTQAITAALPLLLAGTAAPALALDAVPSASDAQPAAVQPADAHEAFALTLEISGVVDGLTSEETARVEAWVLGVSGERSPLGSARVGGDGEYLLEGSTQLGTPVLLEVTVWEPGHEDEASTTWYGDSPDPAGAEPLRATGSMDGVDVTVARDHVPEPPHEAGAPQAVPAGAAAQAPEHADADGGLAAAESGARPSAERDAQRLVLAFLATAAFVGGLALLRRASAARVD